MTRGTTTDLRLAEAVPILAGLAETQDSAALPFYAGISRHNLAYTRLAMGDYAMAIADGNAALALFEQVPGVAEESYAVQFGLGRAYFELGEWGAGREHLSRATGGSTIGSVEQWFEAAALLPVLGDLAEARELLSRASSHPTNSAAQNLFVAMLARARLALADWQFDRAALAMRSSQTDWQATTTCSWAFWLDLRALIELARRDYPAAKARIDEGQALARRQGAGLLEGRFRLSRALLDGDLNEVSDAFAHASAMDLLSAAEPIVRNLHRLGPPPPSLRESVARWPQRWLPLLRLAVADPSDPAAAPAATLLDEFGELGDVRLLRRLSRTRLKAFRGSDLGRGLARRRSPRLIVHDLGQASFEIGPRKVPLSSIRRRAAGLLCFLLTRKGHLATRDQVLESLWPEVDPEAALNSLNQTLYFLRRDIEPGYNDDYSAQYAHFESDMVWLDRELVAAESVAFQEQVSRALAFPDDLDASASAVALYRGRFAPEFEYEEWASGWRELLHGQYLHLAETLMGRLIRDGRLLEAADLAVAVLGVDATADHFERELIWLYGTLGARSAAAEQYGHYAEVQRTEYGVEPPTFDEVISGR